MSEDSKEQQRQRHRKAMKHIKTRAEEQQLEQARRARAAKRPVRDDLDDEATFQKIRHPERVLGPSRPPTFDPNTAEGRGSVVRLDRGRALVLTSEGERAAMLAAALASRQQTDIAVGDEVVLHERAGAPPLVVGVLPRRSELSRADPDLPERRRVLAANVDLVVLVLVADRLRVGLIDRLVLALSGSGAALAVCVNKCDLPHDAGACERALAPHVAAGLPVAMVSAVRGDGIDALAALCRGRTCAFVGHSGAGKSTLLNALDPDRTRATGPVRADDGRGRHTTSSSHMSVLANGTRLIDTPGVRAFGLADGTTDAIEAFPEILDLAASCRFRDCSHRTEPGCAVRAAVDEGSLDPTRHAAFLRLRAGDG